MCVLDLEYTICQIQSGKFSIAAKSHRQEGGDPKLRITVTEENVTWELLDIHHGVPETVSGQQRQNRVDFYFLRESLVSQLPLFPQPSSPHNSALRLEPRSSAGTERAEGSRVRLVTPICRFSPIASVTLYSQTPPAFQASAENAILHMDYETGPKSIYGHEIFEIHLGVEAEYELEPLSEAVVSHAVIEMSHEMYATVLRELRYAGR